MRPRDEAGQGDQHERLFVRISGLIRVIRDEFQIGKAKSIFPIDVLKEGRVSLCLEHLNERRL